MSNRVKAGAELIALIGVWSFYFVRLAGAVRSGELETGGFLAAMGWTLVRLHPILLPCPNPGAVFKEGSDNEWDCRGANTVNRLAKLAQARKGDTHANHQINLFNAFFDDGIKLASRTRS